jgi:Flp pilus assembly protein TadB
MPMPLDPLHEPDVPAPDHVPDEFVRMYGRQAQQSVQYSRSRRYRVSKQVHQAGQVFHDTELWSIAALVFFWAVAGVALVGGLIYAVFLWPEAGLALVGVVMLILAISLAVGAQQSRRHRQQGAEEYSGFSL